MTGSNESSILLRVSVSRSNSVIGVALGFLMTTLCAWILSRGAAGTSPMPLPLTLFVGLIGLAMLLATLFYTRMLVRPPIMLEVTPLGLVTYMDIKSHNYTAQGRLIPWRSLRYIDFYRTSHHINTARLHLTSGHGLPITELSILGPTQLPFNINASRNTGIDWDNTVFLNATTNFGSPQAFVQKLEDLRQKCG